MNYGDISPAIAAYATVQMLKRALPLLVFEKFGQVYPLPTNNTQVAKFRRYFLSGATGAAGAGNGAFYTPLALTPLLEGVTPEGRELRSVDYTVQLAQYGDYIPLTDVILDTHTDNILNISTEVLGENAAETVETLRFNVLKAGTNVFYANGVNSRAQVAAPLTRDDQRRVTSALNRQNAKKITSIVASTPNYGSKSVEAGFVAVVHTDLDSDIRNMANFRAVADYGTHVTPWEGEIGSVEQVRYIATTVAQPFLGAGVPIATAPTMRSLNGVSIDVYPVIIFARDAYGIVPLKGKSAMTPMVVNPKPAPGDPLGQRGTVGWKLWTAAIILQDAFMARIECAVTT